MKYVHTITMSVFIKTGENEEKLKNAMVSLIPFSLETEKIKLNKTVAEGFENKITILEVILEKERHTTKFIDNLKEKLGTEACRMLASQEDRIDEECYFYARLDKKPLIAGEYKITESGDCIHIKMSIAAFPKKRETAIQVVKKMLG